VLQGGSATGASGTRTGGNVTIDAGTGNVPSTNGTVTIGASALALTLGSSTNNTSTTLQSGSGGVSLTSTGSGSFSTSGSLSLTSGGAATWKTSSGNLTVQANGSSNLNLETSGAGTINLGQNNTTTVNIASNSNTVRTINIGNVSAGTQAQTISIGTAGAGTGSVTLAAGSVGVNLNANVNSPTNINTGGSTGTITLGGGSSNLVINSVNFDVTSGGTATAATSVLTPLLDAASAVALTIGGTNASSLTLGRAAAAFTLQGNASSTLTATSGGFTTTLGFTTPTANRAISLPDAGGTICTTVFATCSSVYGAASGSGSYIQNGTTTQTANFYVQSAASGNIGGIIQGAAGQTVDIFRVISSGGVINMAVKANGSTEFTPTADSASAFNVRGSAGDNMLTIDTVSSRIGLNLGGTNTPTMNGPGLQVRGGLQLSDAGNSGLLHNFTTPGSSTVPSRLSVNAESLSAGSSIISIGLTGTSNANSRAMLIYDGRANSQSLPGLAVVNPNETSTIGLTWRGSNSTGYFTSQPSAGTSTSNVTLQSGDITGGSGLTTGAVALTTGTGAGGSANISTGAIAIDPGAATGTGTAGAITIGGTNASSVAIGGSSTPINLQGTTTVTGTSSTALTVNTGANTNKGVVIQGGASQTSYLLEAYNNTDRVFSVDSYGQTLVRTQTGHNSYDALRVLRADGANILNVDTSSRVVGINNTQGNGASVVATLALNNTADRIGIQIAANGTQTADLLRAYDSSGNTALSITNTGNLLFGSTAAHTTSVAQSAAGAGNNLTISAGQGASGQLGGNLVLQAGANGTASGSPGSVVIRANGGDSATAFQIQTADGTGNLFTADTSNRVVKVALGSTASTNAVCSDLANSTAPTAGTAYELRDCSSAPAADYAENYPVASGVSYGAIVALGDKEVATYDTGANGQIDWTKIKGNVTQLVKSAQAYQSTTIGIVSDNHSDFTSAGYNIKAQDNPMPVALNGRVPVQVSDSSWPIQAGDYLTTSTDPGKAMKATDAGFVIGKALASWTPGTGTATVMVFVEPGYYPGSSITNLIQNGSNATLSSLTVSGSASITKLTVQKLIILADLTINGHIITGNNNGTTTVQADANSGSTGICTISGNDTSGQITITPTGTGIAEGAQCTITLSSSFTTAPHPVISPVETNAQSVGAYANATTNTITVGFTNPGKAAKSYTFNYFNVQ
jgi:hypothetical protein